MPLQFNAKQNLVINALQKLILNLKLIFFEIPKYNPLFLATSYLEFTKMLKNFL